MKYPFIYNKLNCYSYLWNQKTIGYAFDCFSKLPVAYTSILLVQEIGRILEQIGYSWKKGQDTKLELEYWGFGFIWISNNLCDFDHLNCQITHE